MEDFSDFIVGKMIKTEYIESFRNIEWKVVSLFRGDLYNKRAFEVEIHSETEMLAKVPKMQDSLIETIIKFRKLNPELFKKILEKYPELLI